MERYVATVTDWKGRAVTYRISFMYLGGPLPVYIVDKQRSFLGFKWWAQTTFKGFETLDAAEDHIQQLCCPECAEQCFDWQQENNV